MLLDHLNTAVSPESPKAIRPTRSVDHMINLDILRGVAVLGILTVNALSYAWPMDVLAYEQARPFAMTGTDGLGYWVTNVFFEDKFRTLFCMLFGISIFLVGGERSDMVRGKLLRQRLFWLAIFGLVHGLFLWFGDILLAYACIGFMMMLMRSWPAKRLLWIGGGITALFCAIATAGPLISALVGLELQQEIMASSPPPTSADVMAIVDGVRSGYVPAMIENLKAWALLQLLGFPAVVAICLPLMMLGLGLFKSGFFSGRMALRVYVALICATGINLALFGYYSWIDLAAAPGANPTGNLDTALAGLAPLITLGYASMVILALRFGLRPLVAVFAPVGRMAFTNYISQTLIMTSLFYMPWGPQLYGTMGPGALWVVIGCVWAAQLVWSPVWLSRFEMGPLEWVWRKLTYGGTIPLRRVA